MSFDRPWQRRDPLAAILDALAGDDAPPAPLPASGAAAHRPQSLGRPLPATGDQPDPPAPRPDALRPEIALPSWRGYDPKALAGPRPYPWCPTPAACRVLIRNLGDPDRVPCRCREPGYRGP